MNAASRGGEVTHVEEGSLAAAAVNRDPIDVAEEWVTQALARDGWECRDNYPYPHDAEAALKEVHDV